MYSAFGLLTANCDFTMDEAARRLAARLPAFRLERQGDTIGLSTDDWEIHLTLNESPEVIEESREIARRIGGAEDATDIASCARRVELSSDYPDAEMAHFNDYLLAVEVLQSFKGLIAVDPREPSIL